MPTIECRKIYAPTRTELVIPSPDFTPEALFEKLTYIQSDFTAWQSAKSRSTSQLWNLLGRIYELSIQYETSAKAKAFLVRQIYKMSCVRASSRWTPAIESCYSLLITFMLGREKAQNATRSQWIGALNAAKGCEIEHTQGDFTKWITAIGGVTKAIKSGKASASVQSLETALAADTQVLIGEPIGHILISDDKHAEGEFVLVLARVVRDPLCPLSLVPHAIDVISDAATIQTATHVFIREHAQRLKAERLYSKPMSARELLLQSNLGSHFKADLEAQIYDEHQEDAHQRKMEIQRNGRSKSRPPARPKALWELSSADRKLAAVDRFAEFL